MAQDVMGELTFVGHMQLVHLNLAISIVQRGPSRADCFSWPAGPSGLYTARSTYHCLCFGAQRVPFATCICRSWALLKCKIFVWLAVQHRIWTSDRGAKHGLQDQSSVCYTCLQEKDNAQHILIQCVYTWEVGHEGFNALNMSIRRPEVDGTLID